MQTFYLKYVCVFAKYQGSREAFRALAERLRACGIALIWADRPEEDRPEEDRLNEDRPYEDKTAEDIDGAVDISPKGDGLLWITDSSALAKRLAAAGAAFAVYLHPGNAEEDFSGARYGIEDPAETDAAYLEQVYRRLAGIPWDILETDRCLIRETVEEDVEAFYRIYSDPEIVRYTEALYPEVDQEKLYVRDYREKVYAFYGFGVWTVALRNGGEIIGRAGFDLRPGYPVPELGFVFGTAWQKQGLAGEVCSALLRYGEEELGFDRMQALVEPKNTASLALCRRLGFVEAGEVQDKGKTYRLLYKEAEGRI